MDDAALLPSRPRRGRPLKFGRPGQLVTLTLPEDVVTRLRQIGPDLGWAVVKLCERAFRSPRADAEGTSPVADLVQLPHRRALILVRPEVFRHLPGVATIPLSDGRAFLALDAGRGIADLELAVLDRLEGTDLTRVEREGLLAMRARLREWRREGVRFHARSLIVAERSPNASAPALLAELGEQPAG